MARDIHLLRDYIAEIKSGFKRAHALAAVEMGQKAELIAKKNIIKNFTGRNGYRLTGRLLNSVFWALDTKTNNGFPKLLVGVRGIPYGAIHEFGGKITPKKAKNLWVKNYNAPKQFKRMSPTEFIQAKNQNPGQYIILNKTAFWRDTGSKVRARKSVLKGAKLSGNASDWHALFFLMKKVTIPERPYLRPAVKEVSKIYGPSVEKHWANIIRSF